MNTPASQVQKVLGPLKRVLRTITQVVPSAGASIVAVEAAAPDSWTPTTTALFAAGLTAVLTSLWSTIQNAWEGKGGVDTPIGGTRSIVTPLEPPRG